jgi:hypothetical protein
MLLRCRMKHRQDGLMARRWAAASFAASAENVRLNMGDEHLRMLKAALDEQTRGTQPVPAVNAG